MQKAQKMSEKTVAKLSEAASDVVYLVNKGQHPTDAVAEAAKAASLTTEQTRVLAASYNAGVASEKRASGGGIFERLADYDLADPDKAIAIAFGTKAAAFKEFLSEKSGEYEDFDWNWVTGNAEVPMSALKQAEECDKCSMTSKVKGPKIHITRTIITMSPKDDEKFELPDLDGLFGNSGFLDFIPKTEKEAALAAGRRLSPELDMQVRKELDEIVREKKAEVTAARREAEIAYNLLGQKVADMASALENIDNSRMQGFVQKAAGLAAINRKYPQASEMITELLPETTRMLIKKASTSLSPIDIRNDNPLVLKAADIEQQLAKVTETTITANKKSAELAAAVQLTQRQPGEWTCFLDVKKNADDESKSPKIDYGMTLPAKKAPVRDEIADEEFSNRINLAKSLENSLIQENRNRQPTNQWSEREIDTLSKMRYLYPDASLDSDQDLIQRFSAMSQGDRKYILEKAKAEIAKYHQSVANHDKSVADWKNDKKKWRENERNARNQVIERLDKKPWNSGITGATGRLLSNIGSNTTASIRQLFGAKDVKSDATVDLKTHPRFQLSDEDISRRQIQIRSDLNELISSDDVISAYPVKHVVKAYNELAEFSPDLVKTKLGMRTALQQYLSQSRLSTAELEPYTKMELNLADIIKNREERFLRGY